MKKNTRYEMRDAGYENGSALILAVVLTSLLAIVGVLFLMASRMDKIASSAVSQNTDLDMAVDAVIARIAEELALDVPRFDDANGIRLQEYYDYPDINNAWLACSEPVVGGPGSYTWVAVSDVYSTGLRRLDANVVPDYQPPADVCNSTVGSGPYLADADGDGVSDSFWVALPNITSGRGVPIYAAIRVVDNSAMLNVNTAYEFDPCEVLLEKIDGSSLMQINLMALADRPNEPYTDGDETSLRLARTGFGDEPTYERNVVWRYYEPGGLLYTPFDISDELELRNRFLLDQRDTHTRIEELGRPTGDWVNAFRTSLEVPIGTSTPTLDGWFLRASVSADPDIYDYRHIATTYNMDRIITPRGGRMVNVNNSDKYLLYAAVREGLLDGGIADPNPLAAQIAVNIKDFRDGAGYSQVDINDVGFNNFDPTDNVTTILVDGKTYYGFERPCVYISELVHKYVLDLFLDITGKSYAIELHKPYLEDNDPCGWELFIDNSAVPSVNDLPPVPIIWSGSRRFHVIKRQDPNAPLSVGFSDPNGPNPVDGALWVDPEVELSWPVSSDPDVNSYNLYLGTDFNGVEGADKASDEFIANSNDSNYPIVDYNAAGLLHETTYYWRIDVLDDSDAVIGSAGEVWHFTTGPNNYDYNVPTVQFFPWTAKMPDLFRAGSVIELRRPAEDGNYVVVDSVQVPGGLVGAVGERSFQRDITRHKCIRRLWDDNTKPGSTLGYSNSYVDDLEPEMIQAHPYLEPLVYKGKGFKNIGEIGKVFSGNAYTPQLGVYPPDIIGYNNETEHDVRINLADPNFQRIFDYLTVFDPSADGINNDGDVNSSGTEIRDQFDFDVDGDGYPNPGDELKIPGRININTAFWYVIEQLPWVTSEIAQAIVYYRSDIRPFESIGQLNDVDDVLMSPDYSIYRYGRTDGPYAGDEMGFPDLTPGDGVADDLEERDLIFARISNLVTVRSDVFTAYILIRIGRGGPQKRVIAILDRSNVYADGAGGVIGSVRVRALHPVPDPR
jgi:hypothetical protein